MIVYAAPPRLARALAAFQSAVALCTDRDEALAAATAAVPGGRARTSLSPTAATQARELVTDRCRAWGLNSLQDTAAVIAAELADNAFLHARTDLELTMAASERYLRIAVRDWSTTMPAPSRTARSTALPPVADRHGLDAVAEIAVRWKSAPLPDGKVVRAALRTTTADR